MPEEFRNKLRDDFLNKLPVEFLQAGTGISREVSEKSTDRISKVKLEKFLKKNWKSD